MSTMTEATNGKGDVSHMLAQVLNRIGQDSYFRPADQLKVAGFDIETESVEQGIGSKIFVAVKPPEDGDENNPYYEPDGTIFRFPLMLRRFPQDESSAHIKRKNGDGQVAFSIQLFPIARKGSNGALEGITQELHHIAKEAANDVILIEVVNEEKSDLNGVGSGESFQERIAVGGYNFILQELGTRGFPAEDVDLWYKQITEYGQNEQTDPVKNYVRFRLEQVGAMRRVMEAFDAADYQPIGHIIPSPTGEVQEDFNQWKSLLILLKEPQRNADYYSQLFLQCETIKRKIVNKLQQKLQKDVVYREAREIVRLVRGYEILNDVEKDTHDGYSSELGIKVIKKSAPKKIDQAVIFRHSIFE